MLNQESNYHIGQAIGKLIDRLTAREFQLRRMEIAQGKAHDVRRMNKLREEIASLERRISLAERLQDSQH